MLANKIDIWGMKQALAKTNEKYHGNLDFIFCDPKGKQVHFRIQATSYDYLGYRVLHSGRLAPFGCWHAHGDLFDNVFKVQPEAVIYSGARTSTGVRSKITIDDGNWEDTNIGSLVNPLMFSDSCPCNTFKFMRENLGRDVESWKDFLKSIRDLTESQFNDLICDFHWRHILVRNCRYEYLSWFDGSDDREINIILERRKALECPKKEVPLLIGTMKTPQGLTALEQRLKKI